MIPTPYMLLAKVLAVLTIIASIFGAGWHYGSKNVQADWDKDKVTQLQAQQKAILDNEAKNDLIRTEQDAVNAKRENDYETKLKELNDRVTVAKSAINAAGGLRVNSSICHADATGTETTRDGKHDGNTSGTVALPDNITNDLLNLAAEADRVTEIARSCQAWVKEQGFAP